MKTIFRIVHQQEFDRYLFIHEVGGHIIGLNFHWDNGEDPMTEYHAPNKLLTNIYLELSAIEDEYQRINTALEIYLTTKNFFTPISVKPVETEPVDGRTILIPKSQMELVRNAISFYIQSLDTLRPSFIKSEDEEYTCFDLRQLEGMLQYEVSVKFTEDESKYFTSRHGVDLPEYIY